MTDRHTPEQIQAILAKFKERTRALLAEKPMTPEEQERAEKRNELFSRSQCKRGQAALNSDLVKKRGPIEEGH
ncbi:MAG: hypothetical protein ACPHIA_07835 [Alphaproteobacteria bacterium]